MYSVIVPTLNEGANLWYTLHCLKLLWEHFPDDHELIVVDSGSTDNTIRFLSDYQLTKFTRLVQTTASGAGPVRQIGAGAAKGEILFFLDAHVLVPPTFFRLAVEAITQPEIWRQIGCLHFPIGWNGGWSDGLSTHYELTLESNFWGQHIPGNFSTMTEIAAAGHAGFAVRKEHFECVRGYSAPFVQYGGEETYLDLKFARFGYRNYVFPGTYIMHCSQRAQGYAWSNDTLFRNNVVSAWTVGGDEWAKKVLSHHLKSPGWDSKRVKALYTDALALARDDAAFIGAHAIRTLEEVLADFKIRGVPH
jgi:glycosyltransferase involved in cell wall biosynthesis